MALRVPPQLAELGVRLRQGGPKALRAVRDRMKIEAQVICDLARSNCPVLNHDALVGGTHAGAVVSGGPGPLERSIVVEKGYEDSGRLQMLINCGGTGDTDRYALLMEEGLAPYGSGGAGTLGPLSREKAMSGHDVGGKFMERAANARLGEIPALLLAEVEKALEA